MKVAPISSAPIHRAAVLQAAAAALRQSLKKRLVISVHLRISSMV